MTCEQRDKAENTYTQFLATVKSLTAVDEPFNTARKAKERRLEGFASAVSSMSNTLVELHSHGALLGRLGALVCRYPYIYIQI